jgi:hypothetical protein
MIDALLIVVDSRKAVGLLEEFCGKLQETNEEEHAATLRYTIQLMQSELFQQLIDIQTDYHQVRQRLVLSPMSHYNSL